MTRPQAIAEFTGTFAIVFAGTGAIIANVITHNAITHVGVALTFGLVVMTMIYALGEVSGAHFNPAVTIAFMLTGAMPAKRVMPYVLCQCGGAILASFVLKALYGNVASLGTCQPLAGNAMQSFWLEIVLTFFLVLVILSVAQGSKEQGLMAGIAIGGTVALDALFGGPISGASMNPARSLGPAIMSGNYSFLWIYLTAPVIGAAIAVVAWRGMKTQLTVNHA